jgi:peptide subunit release factor 1 (eRF1)
VLSPAGNRIAERFANDSFEGLHLAGLIQTTEQIVEGAVLEHENHDMIESVVPAVTGHGEPLSDAGELPGAPWVSANAPQA